jgi:serine/threonine protein kinase
VEKGRHYLVMDYFDGKILKSIIEAKGNPGLPQEDVKSWGMQILDMLDYVHNQEPPIIYRDINPENIMIKDNDKRVVFLDFYLSCSDPSAGARGILPAGDYSAPEEKKGEFSFQSDLFALGATMYHLLTGRSENFSEGKFKPIKEVSSGIQEELAIRIEKVLSLDPRERYKSAKEMKEELFDTNKTMKKIVLPGYDLDSKETSLLDSSKPAVIEVSSVAGKAESYPTVPFESSLAESFAKKEIIQPAETKQFPSPFPVTERAGIPTPSSLKEQDLIMKKVTNTAMMIRKVILVSGIIIACVFIYLIYWFCTSTLSQFKFSNGLGDYNQADEDKISYANSQGKNNNDTVAETNYRNAIMNFKDYTKKRPGDPRGYYMLGHSHYGIYDLNVKQNLFGNKKTSVNKTEFLQAVEALKKATSISPDYMESHYYLAKYYYQDGDWVKAKDELNKAKESLSKIHDSGKISGWKDNIDKAFSSFIGITSSDDISIPGSKAEFINKANVTLSIEITGKNGALIDSLSLPVRKSSLNNLEPDEYKVNVSSKNFSFVDKVNLERHKSYSIIIPNPNSNFVEFNLHQFRKENGF